jgi:hypothetical protein
MRSDILIEDTAGCKKTMQESSNVCVELYRIIMRGALFCVLEPLPGAF